MKLPGLIVLDQTGTEAKLQGGSGVKDGRGGGDPSAQARLCERGRGGGAAPDAGGYP